MELRKRVAEKVEQAIQNLPELQIVKDELDWDLIAGKVQSPGGPGYITVYKIQLFAPAVGNDHTTNDQDIIIMDPYCDQETVDRAIAVAYDEIVAEQKAAKEQEVPADLRQQQVIGDQALGRRSASGLIVG